jgi:TatD DNase family protein
MIEQRFTHYMIGYTGIVTFVKAQQIRSCLAITGINHIALETDAPYLAPVPHRGKPNEPSYITYIYETIAQELNLSLPDLQHHIQNNFTSLYHPVIPK